MGADSRVRELVASALDERDLELVDLEVKPGLLRVIADRPGGIDLEAISDLTRLLSRLLDEDDPFDGRYSLEVSSPGLERPLRTPEHFRRFVGTTIAVKTKPEVEGERRVQGSLDEADEADDGGITVAGRRLAYAEIDKATTVFEWGPTPKPGSAKTTKTTKTKTKSKTTTTKKEAATS
jgi:ribosome maturation factor RimP